MLLDHTGRPLPRRLAGFAIPSSSDTAPTGDSSGGVDAVGNEIVGEPSYPWGNPLGDLSDSEPSQQDE